MSEIIIRPATTGDLPDMALLWYEKMTIQQQTDRRLKVSLNGQAEWQQATARWMLDSQYALYVAAYDDRVVGYVIGRVQASPPGLVPAQIGVVLEMTVGVHSDQSGLGRRLLEPLRAWFATQGITHFVATVPGRQPVEQAFWRALGATELTDILWMKI